jgi:hypothetical protein
MYPFMSMSDISFSLLIFVQSVGTALYVFVLMAQRPYSSYYWTLIWRPCYAYDEFSSDACTTPLHHRSLESEHQPGPRVGSVVRKSYRECRTQSNFVNMAHVNNWCMYN